MANDILNGIDIAVSLTINDETAGLCMTLLEGYLNQNKKHIECEIDEVDIKHYYFVDDQAENETQPGTLPF